MKIVKSKAVLLQSTFVICAIALALPAVAQSPVTVPPATMPAADAAPAVVAADTAPVVMPAAEMPMAAAPSAMPAPIPAPVATPAAMQATTTSTTTLAPIAQPGMPSPMPVATTGSAAAVTTPPPGMPTGTPGVVTEVMSNLQDSQSNVSVEDLSKAQDALTRLDLLLQIEKKIGEIKKTQDDRESAGSAGNGMGGGMANGMMGQIPASALVLPGQMNSGMAGGMQGGAMPAISSPVISSAPVANNYEIEQISGTNGSYSAVLTTPDGDRKTVRAGDKLDGRRVESISFDSVRLSAAGSKSKKGGKTLSIHNDTILLTPMAR